MKNENDSNTNAAAERIKSSVFEHALRSPADIDRRLAVLAAERDAEAAFEMIAAAIGMAGLFLGIFGKRRYLLLPALVLPSLYQAATRGETPPMKALRRFGLRTRDEIADEYYALKALRGDFDLTESDDPAQRAERVLRALRPA